MPVEKQKEKTADVRIGGLVVQMNVTDLFIALIRERDRLADRNSYLEHQLEQWESGKLMHTDHGHQLDVLRQKLEEGEGKNG